MAAYFRMLAGMVFALLVIFAILDYLSVTAWLLMPYSVVTGKNKTLTSTLGDTFSLGGQG